MVSDNEAAEREEEEDEERDTESKTRTPQKCGELLYSCDLQKSITQISLKFE
jgi:hypothetical protein